MSRAWLGLSLVLLAPSAMAQQPTDTTYIVKVKYEYKPGSVAILTDKVGPFATRAAADSAVPEIARLGCWREMKHPERLYCNKNIVTITVEAVPPKR